MATTNGNTADGGGAEELWRHKDPKSTKMWEFLQLINSKHGTSFQDYHELFRWSCENTATFWGEVWDFVGIKASQGYDEVLEPNAPMFPPPKFFKGAKLNFAENLLYPTQPVSPDAPALIEASEIHRNTVTWSQLRERVTKFQAGLKAVGFGKGDTIAGYVGNHANAVVAMLAATALGGVWTGISPDSGVSMVLDRLNQIAPKVLVADSGQFYNGKPFDVRPKVAEIASKLESLSTVVLIPSASQKQSDTEIKPPKGKVYSFDDFTNHLGPPSPTLVFEPLPPDQPVYVLFSSGTTGAPKCIVHGAVGTLLQHKKEHILHSSVLPGDRFFYFTTATWMMWHWLISGLAAGATLILYDGSPLRYRSSSDPNASVADDLAMPRLIDELQIKHFGTSAKYLSVLEQKDVQPKQNGLTLSTLRAIYNTASPLAPSTFRYVYRAFGPDINLGSITGGTDIISLFGAANPLIPVFAGEVQAPGLGMAIRAYDDSGKDITDTGEPGDLVCVKPFVCQPVSFWGKDGDKKYKSSYFETFDGVWHHGDFVQFNPATGGLNMLGRSDGVLNPSGVRFGSAEVYNVLLKHFAGQIQDGLCVGMKREKDNDENVVLFVKMEPEQKFDDALKDKVKKTIRSELSPRHVPAYLDECPDIPVTVNGKKIEKAVKQIVSGSKIKTSASVSNPECLEFYQEWADRQN